MSEPPPWEQEFARRVTKALTADHYEHGFRAEKVDSAGENGGAWSTLTWEDPHLSVSIRGTCPCGWDVTASADTPEEIARLLRTITESESRAADDPFRSCRECGFVYATEADWRREYDKAAPGMLMPFTVQQFRAARSCPRCLHDF